MVSGGRVESRQRTEHGVVAPLPLAPDLRVGTQVAGYEIEELIGRGGMGVVYRARHTHLERTVALKVLTPELTGGGEAFRERFVRESRIAASLDHPNIVAVYDAGEDDGLLYLAMQYVDGTDFARLLEQEGALEPERAFGFLAQVANALDAAHRRGLVHRDVKPANVLIDSGLTHVYLTDFGLTRLLSSKSSLTGHGQMVGTLDYMAPEQIAGDEVDTRVDVYALGCMLYHALAGAVPFEKDSHVSVIYAHLQDPPPLLTAARPDLSPGLDAVLARAMAKRREERYATCTALIEAAREALGRTEADTQPSSIRHSMLVVAGEPGLRAMARVGLDASRFTTLEAEDLETAAALVRRNPPDLVLLDWSLAGVREGEACRRLRDAAGDAETRIVALVPRDPAIDEDVLQVVGADDVLRKPFSLLQLNYKVGDLLGPEASGG